MASNYEVSAVDVEDAGEILLEVVNTFRIFRAAGQHQGRHTISGTKVGVLQCLTHEDARLSAIAQNLGLSASVTSRAVEALESDGLVRRRSDQVDGRAFLISLTAQGRSELAERHRYVTERFANVLEGWTSADVEHTLGVLQRLNVHLDQLTDVLKSDEREASNA